MCRSLPKPRNHNQRKRAKRKTSIPQPRVDVVAINLPSFLLQTCRLQTESYFLSFYLSSFTTYYSTSRFLFQEIVTHFTPRSLNKPFIIDMRFDVAFVFAIFGAVVEALPVTGSNVSMLPICSINSSQHHIVSIIQ
jgi:hypothetical protein